MDKDNLIDEHDPELSTAFHTYCTGPITDWSRSPDGDGEWLKFEFEAGGSVSVFTTTPLLWQMCRDTKTVN